MATAGSVVCEAVFDKEWPGFEEEGLKLFRKLLQTETQNFGNEGSEIKIVRILQEKFDEYGISYEVVEPVPGRGNIVARIPGDGSSGKGALLLSAHLDTVRAPTENWELDGWKHDPYGGHIDEEDGYIYGRGAVDMKNMVSMSVMMLCMIKKKNVPLSRDLIFAGVADEERGDSTFGAKYLVENRPELIQADIILTELGGFSFFFEGKEVFPIMIGEKGVMKLKITARGPGGHGSIYHKNNPLATIGDVCSKLSSRRLPLRITPLGRAFVESMAELLPATKAIVFQRLLSPTFADYIIDYLLKEEEVNGIVPALRNTANPVVIGGGDQPNQIPSSAWTIVDSRIVPGCTVDQVLNDIRAVLGPERFLPSRGPQGEQVPPELEIEVINYRYAYDQDLTRPDMVETLALIKRVLAKHSNGGRAFTNLIPGATDLTFYSRLENKPLCLGFTPARLPPDLKLTRLFHGVNECLPVEGFKWGMHVLLDVVCNLCCHEE